MRRARRGRLAATARTRASRSSTADRAPLERRRDDAPPAEGDVVRADRDSRLADELPSSRCRRTVRRRRSRRTPFALAKATCCGGASAARTRTGAAARTIDRDPSPAPDVTQTWRPSGRRRRRARGTAADRADEARPARIAVSRIATRSAFVPSAVQSAAVRADRDVPRRAGYASRDTPCRARGRRDDLVGAESVT